MPARGRQVVGEEWRVGNCFPARFPSTCRSALCASESGFPAGEELVGKVTGGKEMTAATRRSDDGGFRKENKVTGRKHDHRKSKLGFPTWLLYHLKREKGESLIFIIFTERLTTTLHIGLIYIHTRGSHNIVRK